ncbi:MAG: hypothetical protein U1F98_09785 [Verrucomicrobiota bacterium]
MSTEPAEPVASGRPWLRRVGQVILVAGLVAAGLIYWRGKRAEATPEDPTLANYSRSSNQQMGVLYGKSGLMMDDLLEDLRRPGVQAVLVAGSAALAAWVCFVFSREAEKEGTKGT